ncbi:hypothetical protein ABK040_015733 [Willaertia magna]
MKNLKILHVYGCKKLTGECLLNLNNLQELIINETNIHEKYLFNLNNLVILESRICSLIVIGKFLLQMNKLNYFTYFDFRELNHTQINKIQFSISEGMILMKAIYNLFKEECLSVGKVYKRKEDKSINIVQEIYSELLEKDKENKLLKEMLEKKENETKELKIIIVITTTK